MVVVFGAGFVGLTTALGFAFNGIKTYIADISEERIKGLRKGEMHFEEPHLREVLCETINKTLFPIEMGILPEKIDESKYLFACVGTPEGRNGKVDLDQICSVIDTILGNMTEKQEKKHFVVKSSIPPGTTTNDIIPYVENKCKEWREKLTVSVNPEFLREGHCWEDFIAADRIVLGCNDNSAKESLEELYSFAKCPIIQVNPDTAEFIKYESNALLATMISFSNEMSIIARKLGNIDIKASFETLHLDRRWGECNMKTYVYPGCGYGGYCLPKDVKALCAQSERFGYEAKLLKAVDYINENILDDLYVNLIKSLKKTNKIGILGLSFKPNSDDVRQSPSAKLIEKLLQDGYVNIIAHDPVAVANFENKYKYDVCYEENLNKVYENADVVVIMTAWDIYKDVSESFKKDIFDFRYYTK